MSSQIDDAVLVCSFKMRNRYKKTAASPTPSAEDISSPSRIDTDALIAYIDSKFKELRNEREADILSLKNYLNEKIDKLSQSVLAWTSKCEILETHISELSVTATNLTEENLKLKEQLQSLQDNFHENEQKSRLCNVEIQNVPERKNENLLQLVSNLGTLLGVVIPAESIKAVHRVAHNTHTDRPKNIILQLNTKHLRDDVIAASRARRGLTAGQLIAAGGPSNASSRSGSDVTQSDRTVYIREHLTLRNKILFSKTRSIARDKYRYVWTKNAIIQVRKNDNAPVMYIRSEKDLSKL
ncbi:unnamed protein product [Danaus chrysippus]|uniref:(African queen) hypothetical protein n=1 Tax=Danaus chrysippus TaxID=151541 RepID=A0A8J2VPT1_9NEOP|nr:unnamed protein product [Danaus chrysippus]